jgi:hypothetical protein
MVPREAQGTLVKLVDGINKQNFALHEFVAERTDRQTDRQTDRCCI